MSSELVKKLDAELIKYKRQSLGDVAYGIDMARQIVREHEAQQMKEPFYQLDEEQFNRLERLKAAVISSNSKIEDILKVLYRHALEGNDNLLLVHAFTSWAIERDIEQDKTEEEENKK